MGDRAAGVIAGLLSKKVLMRRFCDVLQRGLPRTIDAGSTNRGAAASDASEA